jgi:hypothetical protein
MLLFGFEENNEEILFFEFKSMKWGSGEVRK